MLQKTLKYIAVQFGNPHGFTGRTATFFMNILNRKLYHTIEKNLRLRSADKTLDIGFGNGRLITLLNKKHPSSLIYGIDISEDMLKAAQKQNKQGITANKVFLSCANVMQLPFERAFFDNVYTVNTFYFWNNPDKGLQEIYRIMKPDATFLMVGYTKKWLNKLPITKYNFKKYDMREIEILLNRNRFSLTENLCIEKNKSYCLVIKKTELP